MATLVVSIGIYVIVTKLTFFALKYFTLCLFSVTLCPHKDINWDFLKGKSLENDSSFFLHELHK